MCGDVWWLYVTLLISVGRRRHLGYVGGRSLSAIKYGHRLADFVFSACYIIARYWGLANIKWSLRDYTSTES